MVCGPLRRDAGAAGLLFGQPRGGGAGAGHLQGRWLLPNFADNPGTQRGTGLEPMPEAPFQPGEGGL